METRVLVPPFTAAVMVRATPMPPGPQRTVRLYRQHGLGRDEHGLIDRLVRHRTSMGRRDARTAGWRQSVAASQRLEATSDLSPKSGVRCQFETCGGQARTSAARSAWQARYRRLPSRANSLDTVNVDRLTPAAIAEGQPGGHATSARVEQVETLMVLAGSKRYAESALTGRLVVNAGEAWVAEAQPDRKAATSAAGTSRTERRWERPRPQRCVPAVPAGE